MGELIKKYWPLRLARVKDGTTEWLRIQWGGIKKSFAERIPLYVVDFGWRTQTTSTSRGTTTTNYLTGVAADFRGRPSDPLVFHFDATAKVDDITTDQFRGFTSVLLAGISDLAGGKQPFDRSARIEVPVHNLIPQPHDSSAERLMFPTRQTPIIDR